MDEQDFQYSNDGWELNDEGQQVTRTRDFCNELIHIEEVVSRVYLLLSSFFAFLTQLSAGFINFKSR